MARPRTWDRKEAAAICRKTKGTLADKVKGLQAETPGLSKSAGFMRVGALRDEGYNIGKVYQKTPGKRPTTVRVSHYLTAAVQMKREQILGCRCGEIFSSGEGFAAHTKGDS